MKKRFVQLTLALVIFSTGFVHAEEENIIQLNLGQEVTVEVETILTELDKVVENQIGITDDEEIEDEQLEDAINQVLNIEVYEERNRIEAIYGRGQEKAQEMTNIIEDQYNMKKKFVLNNKEVFKLTYEIQDDLRYIPKEAKDIIKDKDKEIDKETYGEIRENLNNLKADVKKNDYIVGTIAKETRNYIRLVRNKQFREANKAFGKILVLQEDQIDLLNVINKNIAELKLLLENV